MYSSVMVQRIFSEKLSTGIDHVISFDLKQCITKNTPKV